MKLSILTPERRLVEGAAVDEVTLTGSEGQLQLLPGYTPMIGTLYTGPFQYRASDGAVAEGAISTGFFEVHGDEITVLAETLELKAEIDVTRAQKAQRVAEEALQTADLDQHKFMKYQLKLQRALVRQQVAGREFGN